MAQRTILIAGATGNTGRSVVETLSKSSRGYRILALTRSAKSAVAQKLAQLPGVQVEEQSWVEITADWLRQRGVVRAFIASHNQPNQFAEESTFHLAALNAGIEYVVRISTTANNVRPDNPAYYPRQHWAIENLLGTPAFQSLQWSSLQPNVFGTLYLGTAAALVKKYRSTGQLDTLRLMGSEDSPVGIVDSDDVGTFAAHLLVEEDPSRHNKALYVLNGPQDISGRQIVKMVEDHIDTQVTDVCYKDLSLVDQMAAASQESENLILSIKHAMETVWAGECTASTTSKEVLEIAAPKSTPLDMFKVLLED